MILIVGLGNPGKNYDGSKHNVGFAVIERFADAHALGPSKIWKNSKNEPTKKKRMALVTLPLPSP